MDENFLALLVAAAIAGLPAVVAALVAALDHAETRRLARQVAELSANGKGDRVASRLERETCGHSFAEIRRVLERIESRLDERKDQPL